MLVVPAGHLALPLHPVMMCWELPLLSKPGNDRHRHEHQLMCLQRSQLGSCRTVQPVQPSCNMMSPTAHCAAVVGRVRSALLWWQGT